MKSARAKRVFFAAILLALTWAAVELLALFGSRVIFHRRYSAEEARNRMQEAGRANPGDAGLRQNTELWWGEMVEVLHPYFGMISDPGRIPSTSLFGVPVRVSPYGFATTDVDPLVRREPGKRIVVVCGGSFALGSYLASGDVFREELGRGVEEVILLNLAAPGLKQPQQLLILAYMMALGAEFDLVINLDGFNEVALPVAENLPKGVFPYYPRKWFYRAREFLDSEEVRLIGRAALQRAARSEWALRGLRLRWYRSPALTMIWELRDRSRAARIYEAERELDDLSGKETAYAVTGPPFTSEDETDLYEQFAALWARCSEQMDALCRREGTLYFHFLQPNQYLEGSKPMTLEEKAIAITGDHPYRDGIAGGYAQMRVAGDRLTQGGVAFHDLTMLFHDREEVLYIDNCCHVNKAGSDLVARAICDAVLAESGEASPMNEAH
jgi:hypothetical protein